jgi:hypothetical protein
MLVRVVLLPFAMLDVENKRSAQENKEEMYSSKNPSIGNPRRTLIDPQFQTKNAVNSTNVPTVSKREAKLTPKLMRTGSQVSIRAKKPKPQLYAASGEATFNEIARLVSLNDEQRSQISKLIQEVKTLKIINARQEKGLQLMDKEQGDFPKLFKLMSEELRAAKVFRSNPD